MTATKQHAIASPVIAGAVLLVLAIWVGAYALGNSPGSTAVPSMTQPSVQATSTTTATLVSSSAASETTEPASSSSSTSAAATGSSSSTSSSATGSETTTGSGENDSCIYGTAALIPTAFTNDSANTNLVSLFGSYSKMGVTFTEVSTGTDFVSQTFTSYDTFVQGTQSATVTYDVVYASATTYKVDISQTQGLSTLNATAWVQKSGVVLAYDYLGQNITGPEAGGLTLGLMSPFFYQSEYATLVQTLTTAAGIQENSHSQGQFGSTVISLTNYTETSSPVSVTFCGGSLSLTSLSLQTGSVQGVGIQLLTGLEVTGSETYHGMTNQIVSLTVRLTSLQPA